MTNLNTMLQRVHLPAFALPETSRGISFRTQDIQAGDIFFALPGAQTHGIRYADLALSKGASLIISDEWHAQGVQVQNPEAVLLALAKEARGLLQSPVIGVTGSVGKTSTKTLIAQALYCPVSPGNLNTLKALACLLVRHALSSRCSEPLVLELGIDHPGEMATVVELLRPSHGVLTSIAASHLAAFGTLEQVAFEKSRMFRYCELSLVSTQAASYASPHLHHLKTYGLEPEPADFTATYYQPSKLKQGLSYQGLEFELPFAGRHLAYNAVAALALCTFLGKDLEPVRQRLAQSQLEPGRLSILQAEKHLIIDDSYNSNPLSSRLALEVLRDQNGPRVAILGDMLELGPDEIPLHIELGKLSKGLDLVIAIGSLAHYIQEGNQEALHFTTVQEFLDAGVELPQTSSVLVKASRGMQFETIVTYLKNKAASIA